MQAGEPGGKNHPSDYAEANPTYALRTRWSGDSMKDMEAGEPGG